MICYTGTTSHGLLLFVGTVSGSLLYFPLNKRNSIFYFYLYVKHKLSEVSFKSMTKFLFFIYCVYIKHLLLQNIFSKRTLAFPRIFYLVLFNSFYNLESSNLILYYNHLFGYYYYNCL